MPLPDFEVIRDPVWNNIRIDPGALALVESAPFQRLRYIRQLGHAFLVYPGATHTRFEHALGTYHLARRTLSLLAERGELRGVPEDEVALIRLAALLHDIGHYPFSHALEEAGLTSHEALARRRLAHPELSGPLDATGIAGAAARVAELITGSSSSPLQGLISGSLDLDKIEYLTRDARMCGVPYGAVDVDRLVHSLTLVGSQRVEGAGPPGSRARIGIHEKGLSALESLLFARYQMYRNVYWHHAVRSATAMFKRLVCDAISAGRIDPATIAESTDEALMETLQSLPDAGLALRLRRRRLYKRALDLPADQFMGGPADRLAHDPGLLRRAEDRLARDVGRKAGEILLDFPAKPEMLSLDLPLITRQGEVEAPQSHLTDVAEALHTSARRFRVFVAEPIAISAKSVMELLENEGG